MILAILVLLIAPLLWLDVKATRMIVLDPLSERTQRILQLLLVWLLPLLGALLVLAVHRSAEKPSRKYREPQEPGEDLPSQDADSSSHADANAD